MKLVPRGSRVTAAAPLGVRHFTPRTAKWTHDPITGQKTKFNYDDIQPVEKDIDRVWFDGNVCARNDYMFDHYKKQLMSWQPEGNNEEGYHGYMGMYGPYWPAHMGYHHHFLKRRTQFGPKEPGVPSAENMKAVEDRQVFFDWRKTHYLDSVKDDDNDTIMTLMRDSQNMRHKIYFNNPFRKWCQRKLDERGIDWSYPYGQTYQYVLKWMLWGFLMYHVIAPTFLKVKAHFQKNKPLPEQREPWVPLMNQPFFIYSSEGIPPPYLA